MAPCILVALTGILHTEYVRVEMRIEHEHVDATFHAQSMAAQRS